jgi:tetratricopeptide (TPR) repeat protein
MGAMTPELARALTEVAPADLGGRIKAARLAAGLTQPELGGEDASAAYLSRIEKGERRPRAELLLLLAERLSVSPDYLLVGDGWEEVRRLELLLDHAELSLVGGEADNAFRMAREAMASAQLGEVRGGRNRARFLVAGALDALGDPGAVEAYLPLVSEDVDQSTRLKAATALSRIWRESGQLERAITSARAVIDSVPDAERATEECIRLTVTLAAALNVDGRVHEAMELCDRAIEESAALSSPVARASAYWNASAFRAEAGEIDQAIVMARRALHLLEDTERVRDLGRLRMQLGIILLQQQPPQVDDASEQLELAGRELAWSEASTTDVLRNDVLKAQARHLAGDAATARAAAIGVLEGAGTEQPHVAVDALVLLGQIDWADGAFDQAREWYRRAITVLTGVGADHSAAQLWFELGAAADEAGLVDEARDAYRRAAVSSGMRTRLTPAPRRVSQAAALR